MFPNLKLDGILEGELLQQSVPNTTVRTLALVLVKGGQRTKIADQNLTITANASGNPRVDLVQWNGTTLSVKAGTAAADPNCPTPDAGNIPIAVVWVPNAFTEVVNMGDATGTRALFIAFYYAIAGLFAFRKATVATQTTTSSSFVDVTNCILPIYVARPHAGYFTELKAQGLQNTTDAGQDTVQIASALDAGTEGDAAGFAMTGTTIADAVALVAHHREVTIAAGAHKWKGRFRSVGGGSVQVGSIVLTLREWP